MLLVFQVIFAVNQNYKQGNIPLQVIEAGI